LNGWLAGGSLEAAERIEAYVEDYARRNKCRRIVTTCRRGWERSWMTKRRGYVAEQVTLTKEL